MSNDIDESGTDAAGESTNLNPENETSDTNTPTRRKKKKKILCIIYAIISILIVLGMVTFFTLYFTLFQKKDVLLSTNTKINTELTTPKTIKTKTTLEPTQSLNQYFLGYMTDERYLDNMLTSRLWTKRFNNVKYYVLLSKNDSISFQTQFNNSDVPIETIIHGK